MISALRPCPKCGWEIPADAPEGGCPGCLLESGLRLLEEEAVVLQIPYSRWLNGPTQITSAFLRLDPIRDPLRGDPPFQKLYEEKQL